MTVSVSRCNTSFGGVQPPAGTAPSTIDVSVPVDLTYPLGAYTDRTGQMVPILGPAGFACTLEIGADGSVEARFREPDGHQPWASLTVRSAGGCTQCALDAACPLFPADASLLAVDHLPPCPSSVPAQEVDTPVPGRSDAVLFEDNPGVDGTGDVGNGVVPVDAVMIFRPTTDGHPGPQESSLACALNSDEACSVMIDHHLVQNWRLSPA